jgi:monoterpene epsilon-lactone hydrolase
MTTTSDPNRLYWEAVARDEQVEWEALAAEPDNIDQEWVDDPAGLWLRPPAAPAGPVVLANHGGGFVGGSAASHRRGAGYLAGGRPSQSPRRPHAR